MRTRMDPIQNCVTWFVASIGGTCSGPPKRCVLRGAGSATCAYPFQRASPSVALHKWHVCGAAECAGFGIYDTPSDFARPVIDVNTTAKSLAIFRGVESLAKPRCCVYMARKWFRRCEDGYVSTRTFFSVLPSAFLLRKARPLAIGVLFHVMCAFSR
jgi:hypothetical protein